MPIGDLFPGNLLLKQNLRAIQFCARFCAFLVSRDKLR